MSSVLGEILPEIICRLLGGIFVCCAVTGEVSDLCNHFSPLVLEEDLHANSGLHLVTTRKGYPCLAGGELLHLVDIEVGLEGAFRSFQSLQGVLENGFETG